MADQIMIATDAARIAALEAKIDTILRKLDAVQMTAAPAWVPLSDYAAKVGRSTKTVRNWIRSGRIETRRDGNVTMVRAH